MIARAGVIYRSLPPIYWTVWLGTLINKLGSFVVPFLALVLTRRGLPPTTTGLIVSLWGAGTMCAGLVGGVLADRWGRKATMAASLFGGALAMAGLGFARDPIALGACAFAAGLMGEMYRPAVAALVADVVPEDRRQLAYGYLYWVVNLGFAVAPVLAALVSRTGDLWLFLGDAITTAIYGVVVLVKVPETKPATAPRRAGTPAPASGLGAVLGDRLFMIFLTTQLATSLVIWQGSVALPLDMRAHGITDTVYGLLMGINGVLIVLFQPAIAARVSRGGRPIWLAVGSVLFGLGFGMNALVGSALGYALGIALWTIGEIILLPTCSAIVADLAPPHLRGRYQGANSMAWGAASALGPATGSAVLAGLGGPLLWIACLAVMLGCAVVHLALGRDLAARTRAKPVDPIGQG